MLSIMAAEEVVVVEHMIEIVERATLGVARVSRIGFFVALIESGANASEHFSEGNVGFAVSVVDGGIVDYGCATLIVADVSAPEIAVK